MTKARFPRQPALVSLLFALCMTAASVAHATWPAGGLHVNDLGNPTGMVGDGSGGVFLSWTAMKAQRISANGDLLIPVNNTLVGVVSDATPCFPDGAGGIYIAYRQDLTISLLRVGSAGNVIWNVTICQTANTKYGPVACPDEAGGALVAWAEDRNLPLPQDEISIYGQRVDAAGNPMWTLDGKRLLYVSETCYDGPGCNGKEFGVPVYVHAIAGSAPGDIPGGAQLIVRGESAFSGFGDLVVDGTGAIAWWWNPLNGAGIYGPIRAVSDRDGGAYVWNDSPVASLYLDRRRVVGVYWGMPVCTVAVGTRRDAVVRPASDGVLIAWVDTRAGNDDIYVQKFSPEGTRLWTLHGVPVCTAAGSQTQVDVAEDFAGGALVVWSDDRNGLNDIYTAHVDAFGLVSPADGLAVSSADGSEMSPRLYTDPAGYGIVSWKGIDGVFAQRLNATSVAVAISEFAASVRGGDIALSATLRSDLGIDFVKVYRAGDGAPLVLHETLGAPRTDRFEYIDRRVAPATTYRYQLAVGDSDGEFMSPLVMVTTPGLAFALEQNQPNPFNPETTIRFVIPETGRATVSVYSADGRLVRIIYDEIARPGTHEARWDGRDAGGKPVSSGVYFCRLHAGKQETSRKLTLLK